MQLQTSEFDISGMQGFINKIVVHLMNNYIISDQQHGFRSIRSCITQLLLIMEHLTKIIDQGISVDTIYLDLKKCFRHSSSSALKCLIEKK